MLSKTPIFIHAPSHSGKILIGELARNLANLAEIILVVCTHSTLLAAYRSHCLVENNRPGKSAATTIKPSTMSPTTTKPSTTTTATQRSEGRSTLQAPVRCATREPAPRPQDRASSGKVLPEGGGRSVVEWWTGPQRPGCRCRVRGH